MTKPTVLFVIFVLAVAVGVIVVVWARQAREPGVSKGADHMSPMPAGAPADQVLGIQPGREAEYQALIAQSKAQLPELKRRFRTGLPKGHTLFITTRVRDPDGTQEQFFVQVIDWTEQGARGVIASRLVHVRGVQYGDTTLVLEGAILDWTIAHPDGSEEGNALGKFLEAQ